MVVSPHSLLDSEGRLRLHGTYYITKQVPCLFQPQRGLLPLHSSVACSGPCCHAAGRSGRQQACTWWIPGDAAHAGRLEHLSRLRLVPHKGPTCIESRMLVLSTNYLILP